MAASRNRPLQPQAASQPALAAPEMPPAPGSAPPRKSCLCYFGKTDGVFFLGLPEARQMVPDLRLRSPAGVRDAPLPGVSGISTKRVASTNSYGKPEQRRAALGAGRWHRRMNMGDTPGRVREPVPSGGLRHHARSTMAHGFPPHASAQERSDEKKRPWGRPEHGEGVMERGPRRNKETIRLWDGGGEGADLPELGWGWMW